MSYMYHVHVNLTFPEIFAFRLAAMTGLPGSRFREGKCPVLLLILCVIFLLSHLAACDIHRAKTHTGKVSPYPGSQLRSNREKSDPAGGPNGSRGGADRTLSDLERNSIKGGGLEAWVCALLATTLVGMTGIFPLLLPLDVGPDLQNGDEAARFKCLLSFAVGGLLGDVFLHLMPEAWSHVSSDDHDGQMKIGVWVLVGLLTFLVLEKIFGDAEKTSTVDKSRGLKEQCTDVRAALPETTSQLSEVPNGHATVLPKNKSKASRKRQKTQENGRNRNGCGVEANGYATKRHDLRQNGQEATCRRQKATCRRQKAEGKELKVKVTGYLNLLANFIDNFTHGLAVAGSFLISNKVGLLTTAAILLHEIPHEIGDFVILLRSGFSRWRAAKAQVCTATGGLCGALLALMSESAEKAGDSAAWILPFTSGGFLNIALVTVLPDLLEETNQRESLKQLACLLCGIAIMGAVNLIVD